MAIRKNSRGKWVADCRKYGGGQISFETRPEAAAHLKMVRRKHSQHDHYVDPSRTHHFFQAANLFLAAEEQKVRDGNLTRGHYDNKVAALKHVMHINYRNGVIGDLRVGELTAAFIEDFILPDLFSSAHATGVKKANILRQLCVWLKRRRHNQEDVQLFAIPLKAAKEPERIPRISKDIIYSIISASSDEHRLIIKFASLTGLRIGEQSALTWDDIDLDARLVHVNRAVKKDRSIGSLKTSNGRRSVPLVADLVADLKEWRLKQPFKQRRNNLVFPDKDGGYATADNWRRVGLHAACKKAGLALIRFHDLRHYFASVLVFEMQETDTQIARLMGHASADFTRRKYAHWMENASRDQELADRMTKAFNNI